MKRRQFLNSCAVTIAPLIWSSSVLSQPRTATVTRAPLAALTISGAINKAGRQRMLSQRMAKAYAQIGIGVLPDRAQKILATSQQLFQAQLTELSAYAPTPDINTTYVELSELWSRYSELLAQPPSDRTRERVHVLNEEVLSVANRGTMQLDKLAGTPAGKLVNISGRQRMLSQRAAKFFMLHEWHINTPVEGDLNVARKEFRAALALLHAAPETTRTIKTQLELADTQWVFFEVAIEDALRSRADAVRRQNVANASERILEIFENVTGLYEAIGNATTQPPKA